ncbi:MAG: alpha/beta fold hydrolase [Planctomycetota bacterium]|jgi:pimeloyl-ACP methyl ester carboxylesterase
MRAILIAAASLLTTSASAGLTLNAPDGTPIAYDVYGEDPVALVFVHGWMCNRTQWNIQAAAFADKYTVVTIDLPGHGESGKGRADWDIVQYGSDIASVVEQLELEYVVFVGHSMGAPVTLVAASKLPDRTIGVVPVDALHNAEFEYPPGTMDGMIAQLNAGFDAFMERFVGAALNPQIDTQTRQNLIEVAQNNDPAIAEALFRAFERLDFVSILAACRAPVHAINATAFKTEIDINRQYNPAYDATIIENTGHWPMVERPEEFNDALEDILDSWLGDPDE